MASVGGTSRSFEAAVKSLVRDNLGRKPRKVTISAGSDAYGEPVTNVGIELMSDETADVARLIRVRREFADIVRRHDEVATPQLDFRVTAPSDAAEAKRALDAEIDRVRKLVEGMRA
jgi:hypothetical protein